MLTGTTHPDPLNDEQHPFVKRRSRRLMNVLLGSALLFFTLGIGNLIFGLLKSNEYQELLSRAYHEIEHANQPVVPLVESTLSLDAQNQYIGRLKARADYYNLVVLGGKCFLAVCGILLLLCLISRNQSEDLPEEENSSVT